MDSSVSLAAAFGAGVVSFLSPCILPLLPTYTAFLAGSGSADADHHAQWRFMLNALCFLSGFTVVFVVMGATASFLGEVFFHYQEVVRKLGALFMIAMGLQLAGVFTFSFLHREYRPLLTSTFQGPFGAFILGIAFTAGWTPCTGPILASILVYAGATATVHEGAVLLFVYSLGFSVPFFLIALLLRRYMSGMRKFYKWLPLIQKSSAFVLVLIGIIMYLDMLPHILSYTNAIFGL